MQTAQMLDKTNREIIKILRFATKHYRSTLKIKPQELGYRTEIPSYGYVLMLQQPLQISRNIDKNKICGRAGVLKSEQGKRNYTEKITQM